MNVPRSAGVQLHPTSLPGGRLGREAYAFVDWLAAAGQSWWQTLPLGPPDRHRSPYKAASAFASWPGLLAQPRAPVSAAERIDFRDRHAFWIEEWLRSAGGGGGRAGGAGGAAGAGGANQRAVEALDHQVRFEREWGALRGYAVERGVRLIGDVPIYVAPRSADHLAHPELFRAGLQAGVPPDAFTADGQLWGNPIYDWPALRRRRYRWWTERLRRALDLFDLIRIDHFRGFVAYWAVPAGARTARGGRWERGPGRAPFDAARSALRRELPVIAEDLGVITPPVTRLREALGFPGMVVLQFGFDPEEPSTPHHPSRHHEHSVAYTGTHDHDTLRGWWATLPAELRAAVRALHPVDDAAPEWDLIALTFASPAMLAMTQLQDVLGLGSEARMNMPGTRGGSWRWRMREGALTGRLAARLREATEAASRARSHR